MIGIYKITSPSNKIYIGSTINFKNRMNQYRWKNSKEQVRLHRSLSKYGFEDHIVEFIEECLEEELNTKERYWQEYYNVCGKNGLNCLYVETSEKKRILSDETKEKIRLATVGEKNPRYGIVMSEETKNKIREKAFGRKCLEKNKIIQSEMMMNNELSPLKRLVIDTITNEIYTSIRKAALMNNINYSTLKSMLNNKFKNKTNLILYIDEAGKYNI